MLDIKHRDMLDIKQFCKLDKDPTKTIETKVQETARKTKDYLSTYQYRTLYPFLCQM